MIATRGRLQPVQETNVAIGFCATENWREDEYLLPADL
jgi:hypothetical protein